jgi:hypothetical protein
MSKNNWRDGSITKVTHLEKPRSFRQLIDRVFRPQVIYTDELVMVEFHVKNNPMTKEEK